MVAHLIVGASQYRHLGAERDKVKSEDSKRMFTTVNIVAMFRTNCTPLVDLLRGSIQRSVNEFFRGNLMRREKTFTPVRAQVRFNCRGPLKVKLAHSIE